MSHPLPLDLLSVLIGVVISLCCLLSWGQMTLRLLGIARQGIQMQDAWIGLATIISVVNLLQLIVPVTWHLSLAVLVVALANGYFHEKRSWIELTTALFQTSIKHPVMSLIGIMGTLILCAGALLAPGNYDSGLYHFPTITWLNLHPITLGLGNLHGRLAFNQSYFSFVALLNAYPLWNIGYALAGPTLLILGWMSIATDGLKKMDLGSYLQAALMMLLALQCTDISAPTPDLAINVLQMVIFAQMLVIFWQYSEEHVVSANRLVAFAFQCFLISTIKLSGALFGFTALIVVIWKCALWNRENLIVYRKFIYLLVLFALVHLLRSILLSGAPFYPATIGLITELRWSIPLATIQNELNWTYSWARRPGYEVSQVLGNWDWFKPWLKSLPVGSLVCGLITIIFLPWFWIAQLKNPRVLTRSTPFLQMAQLVLIPLLTALVFWFFTAPDIRFLGVIYVLLAILTVWLTCGTLSHKLADKIASNILTFGFVGAVTIMMILQLSRPKIFTGLEALPAISLKANPTMSGQLIYSPSAGEQCGHTQLPCTPYFNENLKKDRLYDWWLLYSVK